MPFVRSVERKVVINDCELDFGLGKGVVYTDVLVLKAANETMASLALVDLNRELLAKLARVEMKEVKRRPAKKRKGKS